mmetsp:Transcript_2735/g.17072  ORF Transcript_2735/g.17072 Transcript_2735/m.17072 type:complete len:221 (-) Transcript_2735:93-755(-)
MIVRIDLVSPHDSDGILGIRWHDPFDSTDAFLIQHTCNTCLWGDGLFDLLDVLQEDSFDGFHLVVQLVVVGLQHRSFRLLQCPGQSSHTCTAAAGVVGLSMSPDFSNHPFLIDTYVGSNEQEESSFVGYMAGECFESSLACKWQSSDTSQCEIFTPSQVAPAAFFSIDFIRADAATEDCFFRHQSMLLEHFWHGFFRLAGRHGSCEFPSDGFQARLWHWI